MQRYRFKRNLSNALYGEVSLYEDKKNNELVAIKRMDLSKAKVNRTVKTNHLIREDAFLERYANQTLSINNKGHANVLRMRDDFEDDDNMYLVFDYCSKGELFSHVSSSSHGRISESLAKKYMLQIVQGVRYIHRTGFAHCDLSLENVLINAQNQCQVCDFGLVGKANQKRKEVVGKLFYMAPEVYAGKYYDGKQADVWSLGVMLFIMITGIPPVEIATETDSRFHIIQFKGIVPLIESWKLTHLFSAGALRLISRMLVANPEERITVAEMLQLEYFQTMPSAPTYAHWKRKTTQTKNSVLSMMKFIRERLGQINLKTKTNTTETKKNLFASTNHSINVIKLDTIG